MFYINIDARTDRRAALEAQLDGLGLAATRQSAVIPTDIAPDMLDRYCDTARLRHVTPTELACTLSHRAVWQRIVDANLPWALVLEDDAVLSCRLAECLASPMQHLDDLHVIKLETRGLPVLVDGPDLAIVPGVDLGRLRSFHYGAVGYLVSRAGAELLLAAEAHYDMPVDDLIFSPELPIFHRLRVRQATPGLVVARDVLAQQAGSQAAPNSIAWGGPSRRAALVRARRSMRAPVLFGRRYWRLLIEGLQLLQCRLRGGERTAIAACETINLAR